MKVVFSKEIEEKYKGSGYMAKDVTARHALIQYYLKYPHLVPRQHKAHFDEFLLQNPEVAQAVKEKMEKRANKSSPAQASQILLPE